MIDFNPDIVYISSVFIFNGEKARQIDFAYSQQGKKVISGGLGCTGPYKMELLGDIEHIKIDYEFFDLDYSIGFSSRGCIRQCEFCYVPKIEGGIRESSPIEEILGGGHDKILLLDGNFVASPKFEAKANYLIDSGLKVCLNQGLDLRIVNEKRAKLLKELRSTDKSFRNRRYYGAWDRMADEEKVVKGLQQLIDAGVAPSSIYIYTLTGFDTAMGENLDRFEKLRAMGVEPFVMIYENNGTVLERHFSRWVNRRIYRNVEWGDYDRREADDV